MIGCWVWRDQIKECTNGYGATNICGVERDGCGPRLPNGLALGSSCEWYGLYLSIHIKPTILFTLKTIHHSFLLVLKKFLVIRLYVLMSLSGNKFWRVQRMKALNRWSPVLHMGGDAVNSKDSQFLNTSPTAYIFILKSRLLFHFWSKHLK